MDNTKKAKILYLITQGEFGGAQHYIYDLCRKLKDIYEIEVAFKKDDKSKNFKSLLDNLGIKYHELNELRREVNLKQDFKAIKEIRELIKKIKPQIVHLNSSKMSVVGSLAQIGLKTKLVYTAHGWVFNEDSSSREKSKYIMAERFTAMFKDKIICVSEFDRQSAITKHICNKNKLSTIHNGIDDFELLDKETAQSEISKHIDDFSKFLSADFVIGSIGYLYKNKGFDYLINSVKLLTEKNLNPLLIIIGNGPEENELRNWIDQLKLHNNVVLLGEIKNASRLLKAFDIYACSSTKEGLSYTLIEAMTASLPIVTTNVGGNPELITHQKEGLVIEAANAEELAINILKLKNDSDLAKKYAETAHKKAINEFAIEQMIQKTKYIYESLLN